MVNRHKKGANFERLIANRLKDAGYETKRGYVFYGESDIVGLPGYHIECKAQERMELYKWYEQSKKDAKENEIPIVIHKQNRKDILVSMAFDDFIKIIRKKENL